MTAEPTVIVLGGPNGAGKSTAARDLLPRDLPYINADEIAKSLPGYPSTEVDLAAGRLTLGAMEDLARRRQDFAVETTLSGRTLASRIGRLKGEGYRFELIYLWVPSPDLSVQRVACPIRRP